MSGLFQASEDEIRSGYTMDVYFERTHRILDAAGLADVPVKAEFTCSSLPNGATDAASNENQHRIMPFIPLSGNAAITSSYS